MKAPFGVSEWVHALADDSRVRGAVLVLSCGSGAEAQWLASLGHLVWGVDQDEAAVDLARETARSRAYDVQYIVESPPPASGPTRRCPRATRRASGASSGSAARSTSAARRHSTPTPSRARSARPGRSRRSSRAARRSSHSRASNSRLLADDAQVAHE